VQCWLYPCKRQKNENCPRKTVLATVGQEGGETEGWARAGNWEEERGGQNTWGYRAWK